MLNYFMYKMKDYQYLKNIEVIKVIYESKKIFNLKFYLELLKSLKYFYTF